jgi:hypothetical protein
LDAAIDEATTTDSGDGATTIDSMDGVVDGIDTGSAAAALPGTEAQLLGLLDADEDAGWKPKLPSSVGLSFSAAGFSGSQTICRARSSTTSVLNLLSMRPTKVVFFNLYPIRLSLRLKQGARHLSLAAERFLGNR